MKRLSLLSFLLPAMFGAFTPHMAERGAASGGSKIEKELVEATDLESKRGEGRQDFLVRLMSAIGKLNDKVWDALSQEAQDWFNNTADFKNEKKNAGKDLPDFPDVEQEEEQTTTRRRSSSSDKEETSKTASPDNLKEGQRVKITNKRGKVFSGEVVELTKKLVVVKGDDGEDEIDLDRIDLIEIFHGTAGGADEPADPVAKGNTVTLTTKRGKEVTGKIVEVDGDVIVLDVDGKEEEFNRDRVESIKPAGGKQEAAKETTSRRSSNSDAKQPETTEKPKRANNEGVSIGTRIKELIAENLEASEEAIHKLLKKEGLDFKDNTLKLNYVDCHKFLDVLKAKKLLKA